VREIQECEMKTEDLVDGQPVDSRMVSAFGMTVGEMAMEAGKAFAEAREKAKEKPSAEEEKKT
jgi:hypothetical protein